MPTRLLAASLLVVLAAPLASAQAIAPPRLPTECDYRACAYNIVPRLSGLVVTRGADDVAVAPLGFLWTQDITPAFFPEAQAAARAAVRTRRLAAVMTDVGLVAGLVGAIAMGRDGTTSGERVTAAAGATLFLLSVPVQFAADGHLARAVWLHNERYATRAPR